MSGAELGIAVGGGILTEIAKLFYKCIGEKIGRVFKHQSYMKDLYNQLHELSKRKEREERGTEHARRQGDEIYEDVTQWLSDANELIERVENPNTGLRVQGQANTRCFKGICPNFMTRYKLSKQAEDVTQQAAELLGKNFAAVSYRPVLQRTPSMFVRDYEAFDSRESVLQGIMEALRNAKLNRIGVHGMGGVGKTTLVNIVAGLVKQDKLFDDVAIADFSQNPDHKRIREIIACDLGLEFRLDETEPERALRLRNRLKKGKRALVILDNIWTKPNLEDIGIPLPDEQKGSTTHNEDCQGVHKDEQRIYKILLTSRSRDLLSNEMRTQQDFLLETLSDGEAQNLFWKIVGYSAADRDVFQDIAGEIVKKCGGLPLAVATIASALKNQGLHHWKDALGKLRANNPMSIPEMDGKVFKVIKLSFDFLQSDEAKSLLLLCTLVGSKGTTCDYLLRYGTGLGLFQDVDTLEMGRDRVNTLIDNLKASCLLVEGYSNDWVKMHDIVHAVALSIASTSKLMFSIRAVPDLHTALKEKISKNPTAISLPCADINDLNQLPAERLECPKLQLFFLFLESPSSQIPNDFFEGMKELRVIDVSYGNLLHLPSSLCYLKSLQTLCLDGCLLGDIATIGELKNLQILSFSRSNIEKLPGEIGQLTFLKLLDLSDCSNLKLIPPNVISRLSHLEELYMDNSFVQWEVGGSTNQDQNSNASLVELNQLSPLTTLNIQILDAQIIPNDFFFQKLQRCRILIGDVWNWSHTNEASRTLKLKLNNSSSCLGRYAIRMLLKITEDLYLDELNGIQNVLYELDGEGLSNLKHLYVQNNAELLYIVNLEGRISCMNAAFHLLESLVLGNLISLEKISHGKLNEKSFNNLRLVKVNKCHGLKHLFSISMVKNLLLLKEIQVTDCKNLRAVFTEEDGDDENDRNSKIVLKELNTIILESLPELTSFYSGSNILECPSLKDMNIAVCPKMKTFVFFNEAEDLTYSHFLGNEIVIPALENLKLWSTATEMIWHKKLPAKSCFQSLTDLNISDCDNLRYILPSCAAESLVQLLRLNIWNCLNLEEILLREDKSMSKQVFPKLEELVLLDLPNLRTFCSSQNRTANEVLEVSEGNLHAHVQPLFDEKVVLPNLRNLILCNIDKLRKIWDGQLASNSFSKLENLSVGYCSKLENIFPSIMYGRLQRLCELSISDCDLLEEIFEIVADENVVVGAVPKFVFPRLASLEFENLPRLKSFYSGKHISEWPVLEELQVFNCVQVKVFASEFKSLDEESEQEIASHRPLFLVDKVAFPNLKELELSELAELLHLWKENSQGSCQGFQNLATLKVSECDKLTKLVPSSVSLPNLVTLEVSNCDGLKSLVTSSTSKSLAQLTTMSITDCKIIGEIITQFEDEQVKDDIIALNELKYLKLDCLTSLGAFCLGNCNFELASLEKVLVRQCPKMMSFSQGVLSAPKLRKVQMTDADDDEGYWAGNLNSTIHQLFLIETTGDI